ncbi:hypothetical protein [Sulfuracidifex tepidarius]|uniref:Uncharacterized protein n=1 Tax=Sulfuracidifex tepidarius TaxID=1294262 RepID=A0A510E526_9CREN|nr:hypothetical protein [Sulfuracidifex tepidarius]BBG27622.1 hypothetical protein IC007_2176 [Sulfuracidifex tepidarius]
MQNKITITSDFNTFYSISPLPSRLNLLKKSKHPPYGIRKVEASLLKKGFAVSVSPPGKIEGDFVGVYVNDPFGMTPVSKAVQEVFGEPPSQVMSFSEFSTWISGEKERRGNLRVIAGGPGAWEVLMKEVPWIDTVVLGGVETLSFEDILHGPKVVETKEMSFVPIISPSSNAEVEVTRKGTKVPLQVIREEIKVQSRFHRYVNLITEDILTWGDDLRDLLRVAKTAGKVKFSQISPSHFSEEYVSVIKDELGLNQTNWISPVLSSGGCVIDRAPDVVRTLNDNFIYPTMFVKEEAAGEASRYKAIVIPIPSSERYFEVLYNVWRNEKSLLKLPFSNLIETVLYKAKETNGEYLRKLKVKGLLGAFNLVRLLLETYLFS